jgi:hypothetical protein
MQLALKLNLYCNNYSIQTMQAKQMKSNEITGTSSLHSYFQTSIKGNSRCNIPLIPTISYKYATSYFGSLKIYNQMSPRTN